MRKYKLKNQHGYSLFELVVVMIVISILTAVSMRYMGNSVDISKTEETKAELNQLAYGIVGNDLLISGSHRIDYGYVGDIGTLPSNLSDLVTNPGLATWDGPYLKDDFYASAAALETEYLIDGWGETYTFASGITISSVGGSSTITKQVANTQTDLLYNSVSFNIVDIDYCPPGLDNKDSIRFQLTYPNGSGNYQTVSKFPSAGGFVAFDSIPIGQQTLAVIELKNNDTLTRKIHINPKSSSHSDMQVPTSIWCDTTSSGGGAGSGIETLRPNGNGSIDNLINENCFNNWQCVDEVTADDNSTNVKGNGNSWKYDLYIVTNSAIASGSIDSIRVYIHAISSHNNQRVRTYLRTNSNNYQGSQIKPSTNYTTYSTTYINNPQSSSAWTWTEIDALQIGVAIRREARVTQVWVEVYYTN